MEFRRVCFQFGETEARTSLRLVRCTQGWCFQNQMVNEIRAAISTGISPVLFIWLSGTGRLDCQPFEFEFEFGAEIYGYWLAFNDPFDDANLALPFTC